MCRKKASRDPDSGPGKWSSIEDGEEEEDETVFLIERRRIWSDTASAKSSWVGEFIPVKYGVLKYSEAIIVFMQYLCDIFWELYYFW